MSDISINRSNPPAFCQYADGECDQSFTKQNRQAGVFLYPSEPTQIAETIETAAQKLKASNPGKGWLTWKDFRTAGQVIFCAICKSCRFADHVIADVTTLNFNLMFEIGFSLGLGLPVVPIRDTTFVRDRRVFDQLGFFEVIGFLDFQNADGLAESLTSRLPADAIPYPKINQNYNEPIYVLKAPIKTEGEVRLMSALKKSALNFKAYDPLESHRLSLQEARKAVGECFSLVGHLLSPDREGAKAHNARCSLVAGMAVARGRNVLLLQEGEIAQPIDYRQIVKSYGRASEISQKLEPLLRGTLVRLQERPESTQATSPGLIEKLDLGDVAAENEIRQLRSCFVRTGQFNQAKRGHARLVIGRKGSGKTAIFYALRNSFRGRGNLVLDLKPEGHQFIKLRETILSTLSRGAQTHTLTAFWNYILLCEVAQKVSDYDFSWAERDEVRSVCYKNLIDEYSRCGTADAGDMSERLLVQVDKLIARLKDVDPLSTPGAFTHALFKDEISAMSAAVGKYLKHKEEVWLLVDNLDKAWPTRGASEVDVLTVRALLDATRKLQRELTAYSVDLKSLVFLRNDIYEHLIRETSDKGKDTAITLNWDDPEVFKDIVAKRIQNTTEIRGGFETAWDALFSKHVGTRSAFVFVLERTLMRPRDLLDFLHQAVGTAINRGHDRVTESDIRKAEENYSSDLFQSLIFELADINKDYEEVMYGFIDCPSRMNEATLTKRLTDVGLFHSETQKLIDLLLWFGFLGIQSAEDEDPLFSYQVNYNLKRLRPTVQRENINFVIHPAFRTSLRCSISEQQDDLPLNS